MTAASDRLLDAAEEGDCDRVVAFLRDPKHAHVLVHPDMLVYALQCQHLPAIALLLRRPEVDASARNYFAVRRAVHLGRGDILDLLLRHFRTISRETVFREAVHVALRTAMEGHKRVELIRPLIMDPHVLECVMEGSSLLVYIARHGDADMMRACLRSPCPLDPSTGNNAALVAALQRGQLDVVEVLLADPRVQIQLQVQFPKEAWHFVQDRRGGDDPVRKRLLELGGMPHR